jgi:hypothetical protein
MRLIRHYLITGIKIIKDVSMEATCANFTKEDILTTFSQKSKAAISRCQMFINPKSNNNINNIDIVIWINELHRILDNNQEVGIKIDHQGKQIVFYIDHIAHQNQSMIYFKGYTESGKLVHFVKHLSELKIQLQTLKSRSSNASKIPFGFNDWDAYEKAKQLNN